MSPGRWQIIARGETPPKAVGGHDKCCMYVVYILKSVVADRYYIGHTNNIEDRLKRHNNGLVKSTKPYRPWVVVYTESKENKNDAYKREFQIKSYKRGEAFKKLIMNSQ